METSLVIGLKTDDLQAVADAIAAQSGTTIRYHDSLYAGEYCRLEMPEVVKVRHNYVDAMDDWAEELHQAGVARGRVSRKSYGNFLGCE